MLRLAAKLAAHGRNPSPKTLLHHHHTLFPSFASRPPCPLARPPPPLGTAGNARCYVASCSVSLSDRDSRTVSLQKRSHPAFNSARPMSYWGQLMQTGEGVTVGFIGVNFGVFLLWRVADPVFMRKHFIVSVDNVRRGRIHTVITSAFSQYDLGHLMFNMVTLYLFGTDLGQYLGPNNLLKLYLSGALAGSLFYLVSKAIMMVPPSKCNRGWDESQIGALGASGAVNAILLLYIFLFPRSTIYLHMLIPLPAAVAGGAFILLDLWRAMQRDGRICGEAHLGGAAMAALWWYAIKEGML